VFDIYLYPFRTENKQEISDVPGFLIATAPKKTTRNRIEDILLLYYVNNEPLKIAGKNLISEILPTAKDLFFKTSGPITTAAKKVAEYINDQILQFNLKQINQPNLIGSLQILVMHKNQIYILHAGESSTYFLSRNHSSHFHDRPVGGQGIGVSKGIRYKFHHVSIETGDRMVLVSKIPEKWTIERMTSGTRLSISHLRRLLINHSDHDFETVVMQFRPGDSSVHFLMLNQTNNTNEVRSTVGQVPDDEEPMTELKPAIEKSVDLDKKEPNILVEDRSQLKSTESQPGVITKKEPVLPDNRVRQKEPITGTGYSEKVGGRFTETKKETNLHPQMDAVLERTSQSDLPLGKSKLHAHQRSNKEVRKSLKPKFELNQDQLVAQVLKVRTFLQKISTTVNGTFRKIGQGISAFYVKASPQEINDKPTLSMTGMLFTALIVPIIVVSLSLTVYLQGKTKIHQEKILESREQLSMAVASEDVNIKIVYLQQAMETLDEAESYGQSDALTELRMIIQGQLDDQLGITRIAVVSTVVGGLDKRISISKLVPSISGDIYALDSSTGRVIRLISSKPDFMVDNSFSCGPGKHGEIIVENLVDIEPVNTQNSQEVVIMGVDKHGALLLCSTKDSPLAIKLIDPDIGWGNIQAIAYDGYRLYILDTGELSKDIYSIQSNVMAFNQPPQSLFNQNIPENLPSTIDISVYQEDLYLLQGDGSLSRCLVGNDYIETNCDLDIGYGQIKGNQTREVVSTIDGTQLSQLFITQPPDPSIYMLDSINSSVYHFSLAVNMQRQICPNFSDILYPPNNPLTAVTVTTAREIHFAYGNDLYFGELP